MSLKTDIRDIVHDYPDHFIVGREKVREYARAVQSTDGAHFDETSAAELGHPAMMAPLTFTAVYALLVQQDFFRAGSAPTTLMGQQAEHPVKIHEM